MILAGSEVPLRRKVFSARWQPVGVHSNASHQLVRAKALASVSPTQQTTIYSGSQPQQKWKSLEEVAPPELMSQLSQNSFLSWVF